MYEVGYKLGRYWAQSDASVEQRTVVLGLSDGRDWVAAQENPLAELKRLIDPTGSGFLDVPDVPENAFVAGFIDGARSAN